MAYTVPESIPRKATAGERLVFHTLKDVLPSDYIVYYEPEIIGRRPDFVVIGPDLGLLVLEVKDYTKSTLFSLNHDEWSILNTIGEITTVKSPFKQAKDNAFHIVNQLKKDKNLLTWEGPYQGTLKFLYGYGVIFSRLTQVDFVKNNLYHVIEPRFVLCRDEIDPDDEAFSSELLIEKLLGMFTVYRRNRYILSDSDIQAIRYHLFPEVRIGAEYNEPIYYQDQLLLSLHNIRTMDLHQENLSKSIGDKHRIIRGVAGSGKTIILASRAKWLAKNQPDWKILVLCYAIPLAQKLYQLIDQMMKEPEDLLDLAYQASGTSRGISDTHVEVYNFHQWLMRTLKTSPNDVDKLIEKINTHQIILPKYDAILIDEGQDFEPEWLELISHVLNPDTQSLLLVEDRAQNIFKRKSSLLQNTGLDFRGRSKILTINYRNTAQIVRVAWDFYQSNSQLQNKVKQGTIEGIEIIPPQATNRKGPEPVIKRFHRFSEEVAFVAKSIIKLHNEWHIPFSEMLILYRVRNSSSYYSYVDTIRQELAKCNLPYYWITENANSKRNFNHFEETIKISTIDSAKGLDFRVVFIVNIENMPFKLEENEEREVALFYIGMTRALEWLFLTYSGESTFTRYLDNIQSSQLGLIATQSKSS